MSNVLHLASPFEGAPHVFLAMPSMDGTYEALFTGALAQSVQLLTSRGVAVDLCFLAGDCHVDDARNTLIRRFRMTQCTDLVFLDADVGWEAETLLELVTAKKDFVAGVYPRKDDDADYPVLVSPGIELWSDPDGLVEVEAVPTGFMRLSRAAIDKMVERYGDRAFRGPNDSRDDPPHVILFERTYENGRRWGGDYAFCRKWREIGEPIYTNPTWPFVHVGKKEWRGQLGEHWLEKYGVLAESRRARMSEALGAIRSGEETAESFVALVQAWDNPWSASPNLLATLAVMARAGNGPILEMGSGLSTLVLAAASSRPVTALEHDPIWAAATRDALADHDLAANVVLAPLKDGVYRRVPMEQAGLLVVDGPPRNLANRAEALRALLPCLAAPCDVVADDADPPTVAALSEVLGTRLKVISAQGKPVAAGRRGETQSAA